MPETAGGGDNSDVRRRIGTNRNAQQMDRGGDRHQDGSGKLVRVLRDHAGIVFATGKARRL